MHQYIGARYVPIFYVNSQNPNSSEWENNVEYEPLVWVSLPNGNMYLSKKTVPANIGSPASNPAYWMTAGQFNAYIQSLQNQINDMNDGTVPGSLQNQINAMNDGTIQGSLQNQIDFIKDGKIAFVTDSYGDTQGGSVVPFPRKFGDFLGLTENVDYVFAHINGAGFVANTTHFTDVLDDLYNNMPSGMLPEDIAHLIIAGGCNDSSITSGLDTAIQNTVAYAKTLFVNAKIYVAVIGGRNTLAGKQALLKNVIPLYMDCARYGAIPLQYTYLPMTKKSNFLPDGIHPNQNGANDIAAALIGAMSNGYTLSDFDAFTLTDYNGTFTASYANVRVYNDKMAIVLNNAQYRKPSAQNITYGNLTLALFDSDYLQGNAQLWGAAYVVYVGGTDDGKRVMLPLVFSNGEIILVLPETVNVLGFNIPAFYLEVPTMNS